MPFLSTAGIPNNSCAVSSTTTTSVIIRGRSIRRWVLKPLQQRHHRACAQPTFPSSAERCRAPALVYRPAYIGLPFRRPNTGRTLLTTCPLDVACVAICRSPTTLYRIVSQTLLWPSTLVVAASGPSSLDPLQSTRSNLSLSADSTRNELHLTRIKR